MDRVLVRVPRWQQTAGTPREAHVRAQERPRGRRDAQREPPAHQITIGRDKSSLQQYVVTVTEAGKPTEGEEGT